MCHTEKKKNAYIKKCIVPTCSCMYNITTTTICTATEVAILLGFMTDNLT